MKYKAIVYILVFSIVYVNACIKEAVKVLFMKRIVTICLMLLFLFFSFSLNNAIDFLMSTEDNSDIEISSDEGGHDLAMLLAIQNEKAVTDMENDASDDMNDGFVHHFPRHLPNST